MRHLIYISVLADFNKTPLRRNALCDLRVIGEMDALVSGKVPRRPLINGIGHRRNSTLLASGVSPLVNDGIGGWSGTDGILFPPHISNFLP
jgi:hypothetical protein